jgi:hypothetical protein
MILVMLGCGAPSDKGEASPEVVEDPPLSDEALAEVSPTRVRAALDYLADDALGGRITGSP